MNGKVNIPCVVSYPWEKDKVDAIIEDVINPMSGDVCAFRVIINGVSVNPEFVEVNGQKLSDYDSSLMREWRRGYERYKKTGRTEYFFEENGDEYWYQCNDFKKHYTRIEG